MEEGSKGVQSATDTCRCSMVQVCGSQDSEENPDQQPGLSTRLGLGNELHCDS